MASKTIEKDKTFSDAEGKLYNYNSMKIECFNPCFNGTYSLTYFASF